MNEDEVKEPKTIAYDYLLNYFGEDSFKEKVILGAGIRLAIRAYKFAGRSGTRSSRGF